MTRPALAPVDGLAEAADDVARQLAELKREEALVLAQIAADVAGLVDPTPISDVVGLGLALADGDYLGAALSAVSIIPWIGDAVAKPLKATRAAARLAEVQAKMAALGAKAADAVNAGVAAARSKAGRPPKRPRSKDVDEPDAPPSGRTPCPTAGGRRGGGKPPGKGDDSRPRDGDGGGGKPPEQDGGRRRGDDGDGGPPRRTPPKEVRCFDPGKLSKEKRDELDRQLKGQEDALNEMTVEYYIKNRDSFKDKSRVRDPAIAAKARRQHRKKLIMEEKQRLIAQGLDEASAERLATRLADERMKTLAALHNPDMIAGGVDEISDFGDLKVNSRIGAQWKTRVDEIDEFVRSVPETARASTKMNVKLKRC